MLRSLILIFTSLSLALGGQFLLKSGMNQVGRIGGGDMAYYKAMLFKTFINPYVLAGLLFYALSSVLWLIVLSRVDLSFAYPFVGIGYIIVMFIAWRYLNEPVSAIRFAGAFLIALGVVLISRS
ncbi:MAG: EamA family transporter [Firmicutes bacterium]|nr:EamA family transporter [Bacillota bacterium]